MKKTTLCKVNLLNKQIRLMNKVFKQIPVINFAELENPVNKESYNKSLKKFHDALKDVGFFYLEGHGIPEKMIDNIFTNAETFFEQPNEVKEKISIQLNRNGRGYTPLYGEKTKGVPDKFEAFDYGIEFYPDHPKVLANVPLHGQNVRIF
jgi:isopenicillin N synthase-like dioxygenase